MSKSRGWILGSILIAFAVNISWDRVLKSWTLPAFLPSSLSGSLDYLTNKKTIVQYITDYTKITDLENDLTRSIDQHGPTLVQIIASWSSEDIFNGVLISSDWYILSPRLPQASGYTVFLANDEVFTVTGHREHPVLWLALIKLPTPQEDEELYPYAKLTENTQAPDIGMFVHAILWKSPDYSLLFGIVDNVAAAGTGTTLFPKIAISFLSNRPTSNGTPIFTHRGELVGMLENMSTTSSSLLPLNADTVAHMLTSIGSGNDIRVASRQATFIPVTEKQVKSLKLPKTQWMIVHSVMPESPLFNAGIQKNDLITEINWEEIQNAKTSIRRQQSFSPGERVPVTVFNAGKYKTVEVQF